ncbi:Predicted amidohydrolase [Caminicella sporogenes DSM 14501]|uniref:Predicted amidohydrolase n=1 Tax=Caminicella sporogenes DSM 14501 TaxID=1121266 RepID=A0A1M6MI15_9FIRM|nr:carbon-nitrogen hydrolase family protein [Caminicella sporogenes]RKD27542.1 carbon-nitrogen hydrolase [Caminicella sporogenes]SHJ83151.1 Predicted amidohydrolase [Caminicella sporogenes DSM 14501]
MSKVKFAICQMQVINSKEANLKKAEDMIRKASYEGADIAVLPEMFNCPYDNNFFSDYAEEYLGKTTKLLSNLAKELEIYIVGGSIPEREKSRIFNTSYIFNKNGELIGRHRKIHLFDVDVDGGITFKESDTFSFGQDITVIETEFCKIGVAICYDMRFPELMRLMTLKGAKVIIVPAAFNMTTGPAHWHALAKIRAVDNQVYFIAASPSRNYNLSYIAYGHSLIVDPWGEVVAKADERETVIIKEVDLHRVNKIREELPLLKHRRIDLYDINENNSY